MCDVSLVAYEEILLRKSPHIAKQKAPFPEGTSLWYVVFRPSAVRLAVV